MLQKHAEHPSVRNFQGHYAKWPDQRWIACGVKFKSQGRIDDEWLLAEIRKSQRKGVMTTPLSYATMNLLQFALNSLFSSKTRRGKRPFDAEMSFVYDYVTIRLCGMLKWGNSWNNPDLKSPSRIIYATILRHVRFALWELAPPKPGEKRQGDQIRKARETTFSCDSFEQTTWEPQVVPAKPNYKDPLVWVEGAIADAT